MTQSRAAALESAVVFALAVGLVTSSGCAVLHRGCGGCGLAAACGAEVGCGMADPGCECEVGCGVEPGCGCGDACGCDGRSMAGRMWCGDCGCGPHKPLINVCTGPECCGGCDPACGCEVGCGDAPGCGCEVGCGDTCGGCVKRCCPFFETLGYGLKCVGREAVGVVRAVGAPLGLCCPCGRSCGGCGELYWNEWHSDPPACCDPCDDCGNWVGPSASGMRAPYDHEFSPRRVASLPPTGEVLR